MKRYLITVLMIAFLTSCSMPTKDNSSIVGAWSPDDQSYTLTFQADGGFIDERTDSQRRKEGK